MIGAWVFMGDEPFSLSLNSYKLSFYILLSTFILHSTLYICLYLISLERVGTMLPCMTNTMLSATTFNLLNM
jgi:hypothetical protein